MGLEKKKKKVSNCSLPVYNRLRKGYPLAYLPRLLVMEKKVYNMDLKKKRKKVSNCSLPA
jgi:hypothetical protein